MRFQGLLGAALLLSPPTWAHFPFLVPDPNLDGVVADLSRELADADLLYGTFDDSAPLAGLPVGLTPVRAEGGSGSC